MFYIDPGKILATGIVFTASSVVCVALRFAMRIKHKVGIGMDDWLILAAMLFTVSAGSICIAGSFTGTIGSHSPQIGSAIWTYIDFKQQLFKKLELAFYESYIPALTLLKLSILCFYRRIFTVDKAFRAWFWTLAVLSILWGVCFCIAFAAICPNFEEHPSAFTKIVTQCANPYPMVICQATIDVIVDLAILVLPVPFILQLQMSGRRKLSVLAVILLAKGAIGCGIIRMVIVSLILSHPVGSSAKVAGLSGKDFSGIASLLIFLAMLELGVGMIAACLPALRPILKGISLESISRSWRSNVLSSKTRRAHSRSGESDREAHDLMENIRIEKNVALSIKSSDAGRSERSFQHEVSTGHLDNRSWLA